MHSQYIEKYIIHFLPNFAIYVKENPWKKYLWTIIYIFGFRFVFSDFFLWQRIDGFDVQVQFYNKIIFVYLKIQPFLLILTLTAGWFSLALYASLYYYTITLQIIIHHAYDAPDH